MKVGNKSLESVIDKVLTPIRIHPVGALSIVGGLALLAEGIILVTNDHLSVQFVGTAMLSPGFFGTTLGSMWYAEGARFYLQAKRLMSFERAPRRIQGIIEGQLSPYCNRNACYAAAIALGFGKEFEQINSEHKTTGKYRKYSWLPGV